MRALAWLLARAHDEGEAARAAEIESELEHHLACARAELERAGHSPAAAAAEAERRFGARTRIEAECLAVHGGIMGTRLHAVVTVLLLLAVLVLSFTLYSSRSAVREARDQAMRQEQLALAALTDQPLFVRDGREVRRFDPAVNELKRNQSLDQPQSHEEPKPEEVVVRIGDELGILDRHQQVQAVVRVASDGKALIPEVGWVEVLGLPRAELERKLTELLKPYFVEVDIRVLVNPTPRELGVTENHSSNAR